MGPTPRRSSVSSKIRPSAAVSRAPARTLSQIGVSRPSENRTGCVLLASGPGPPSARPVCMLKVRQDECQDFARWYPDFCFRTIRKEKRSMHTRRSFLKGAVAATAAVAAGPTVFSRNASAAGQLRILQWSHFVPAYDKWFDPWAKEWGSKHGVDVTVDHVGFADVVPRATAEVAAQSGHAIHMFLGLASAFEEHVIDLADVVTSLEKKYGKPVELARRSTYNPFTKKQFALSDMWVPDPGNYHKEVWTKIGMPNGPVTYDDLVKAAPEIKKVAPPDADPDRCRPLSGHRLQHGRAQHPLVPWRLHPGQGWQRRPQLSRDAARARVHQEALLGRHDPGRAVVERRLQQPGVQRPGDGVHPQLDLRLSHGPGQQAARARELLLHPGAQGPDRHSARLRACDVRLRGVEVLEEPGRGQGVPGRAGRCLP